MAVIVLPQPEVVLISWAKTKGSILALVGTDSATGASAIASSLPRIGDEAIPMPFLTFSSDPGSTDMLSAENIPIINCFLQVDSFARNKPDASTLAQTVLGELRDLHNTSAASRQFNEGFMASFSLLVGPRPLPERDHIFHRYSMDIAVTIAPALS